MSNYTKTTDFAAKDTLPGGDTNKVVRGTEFETEFDAISTAIATKSDTASPTFTGTVTIPTVDINAGAIDGTAIGASSAAAGTFTNLTASGTVNFNGATISNLGTITTANLDGGTIDNAVIGGSTAAAGSFTTLAASSSLTVGGAAVLTTVTFSNLDAGAVTTSGETFTNSDTQIPTNAAVKAHVEAVIPTLSVTEASVTAHQAALAIAATQITSLTSTVSELNILDGVTATTAEINYLDGVTSNIQTQIDSINPSPTLTATASGTLANGDTVIVNSDGTVSAVAQSTSSINPPTAGTAVEFFDNTLGNVRGVFDSSTNKVVLAIKDNNNDGKAYVGTVSGDTISFGSPVTFETNNIEAVGITFDSNANKVVITYIDEGNSNFGAARVGTVSGTSISFGTKVTFTSSGVGENGITFDSNLNKVVFVYQDTGDSNKGKAVIGTVSGTDISFGSPVEFNAGSTSKMTPTFDSSNNKVVIAYRDNGNSDYGTAIVGTVSGTSISFGTEVVFTGTDAVGFKIGATFDSTNNKVVIAYNDSTDDASEVVVGTVSGTSISFGSAVTVNAEDNHSFHDVEFDSDAGTVLLSFLESSTNDHEFYIGTVSGTSISFGTKLKVAENSTNDVHNVIYDSNAKKAVLAYRDQDDSGKGKVFIHLKLHETFLPISRHTSSSSNFSCKTI